MATIRDVARASGVSVATVSYVINNGPRPVREETRRVVLAAMEELEYHPNAMARALVSRRLNTLGVLFGRVEPAIVTNQYVTGVLEGVMSAAAERGFNVTLFTQRWKDAATSAMPLRDGRCDGVLAIAPPSDNDMVEGLAGLPLPVIVVSAAVDPGTGLPFVDVDNEQGVRLAVRHLVELGHRRIAHLAGEVSQPSAGERRRGYLAAMAEATLPVPADYLVTARYNLGAGYEPTLRLLHLPQPPTAIVAGNDALAISALEAARELGVSVPEQLSIVGFDDTPAASMVTPPMTTIRQPMARIGEWATRLLVDRIDGVPVDRLAHRARPELVVRGSTAAPS